MEVDDDPPSSNKEAKVVIMQGKRRQSVIPRRFINIYTYTVLLSIVQFVYTFYLAYTIAVLTTLERRYGMPSLYSGIFLASFEIGHVTIIVFSFTETNVHIPRRLAMRGFVMSIGALFIAATHILVPVASDNEGLQTAGYNSTENGVRSLKCIEGGLPDKKVLLKNCTEEEAVAESFSLNSGSSEAIWAMAILTLAQGIVATASSTYSVIGVLYIDNNVHKDRSSAFIGSVYSMMMLGPAAAFFFSSGVAASIYVHPFDPNPPDVNSTHFIGAWWSGFLLSSAMFLVVSPFFLLFPMKFESNNNNNADDEAQLQNSTNKTSSDDNVTNSDSLATSKALLSTDTSVTDTDVDSEPFTLGTLPRNFLILFRNTTFLALVFVACAQIYITAGYFTFYPKYLESQFRQPTWIANLVSGIANPIPCAMGTFLGGLLMAKCKLSQSNAVLCTFMLALTVAIGLLFMIGLQCEPDEIVGLNLQESSSEQKLTYSARSFDSDCMHRCEICPNKFDPVCGSDGRTYINSCHAGCLFFDPQNRTFSHCGCVGHLNGSMPGFAVPEKCQPTRFYDRFCRSFFAYNAMAFVLAILIILPSTPLTIIMMRCVGPRYKSWSIGLTSSFCSFLSFIPAPVIFGAVFDSHCLLWDQRESRAILPGNEVVTTRCDRTFDSSSKAELISIKAAELLEIPSSSPRNCILYETKSLAVWFHVLTSVFLFISLPANAYVWWKCRENERNLSASSKEKCSGIRDSNELTAATEIEMSSQRVI